MISHHSAFFTRPFREPLKARYCPDVEIIKAALPSTKDRQNMFVGEDSALPMHDEYTEQRNRIEEILRRSKQHPPVWDKEAWSKELDKKLFHLWELTHRPTFLAGDELPPPTIWDRFKYRKPIFAIRKWLGAA